MDASSPFSQDEDDLDLGPPDLALAGLPASLIVSGLEGQLARAATGYTAPDYLGPILDAVALLRARHAGHGDLLAELAAHVGSILTRVTDVVAADWGADLTQLGLDGGGADYESDVLELYRFFVADRTTNALELAYQAIAADRRQLADRYRAEVEKKDQTVREARRVFAQFDDVVVWVSIPSILRDMRTAPESWSVPLAEVLARLGGESGVAGAGFLAGAAGRWPDEGFAASYTAPVLAPGAEALVTGLALRERWLAEAQRKTETDGSAA